MGESSASATRRISPAASPCTTGSRGRRDSLPSEDPKQIQLSENELIELARLTSIEATDAAGYQVLANVAGSPVILSAYHVKLVGSPQPGDSVSFLGLEDGRLSIAKIVGRVGE